MKRSIMCFGWTLGSAALFALGVGCSHEESPAQTPPTGTTSPTFESNVPPTPAPQPPSGPAVQPPPPPAPPPAAAPPEEPKRGATETPAPATAPTQPSERSLCDALAAAALLTTEDVQNGVAIVAVPRRGQDLGTVRDHAKRMEGAMHRSAGESQAAGESCGIFAITRLPSMTTSTTEGMSTARIVIITSNPAEVRDVRREVRQQVRNLKKARSER
jgi:hypothetical protein